MADDKQTFRLKEGAQHSHGGRALVPGDVVELNAQQQIAFRDKFESTTDPVTPVPVDPDAPPGATTHVRQDVGANTQDPTAKTPVTAPDSVQVPGPNTAPAQVTAGTPTGQPAPPAPPTPPSASTVTK
jgi:hypothetical protein